jgi:hypothetical protein
MIVRIIVAAAAAVLAGTSASAAVQPAVGDLFESRPGEHFRGWHVQAEAIGLFDSHYSLFDNGDQVMIALVEPVVTGPRGGVTVRRISRTLIVRPAPGETIVEGHDCPFLSLSPAVAFYSAGTRTARAFFVLPGEIRAMRWFVDELHACEYSGD